MRYERLAEQLRTARREKALSQAALAARSGTSRVTIARFEAGADQDFRLGTLARACETLGLELNAAPVGAQAAAETRLARAQQLARRLDCRRRHAALAVRLLSSPAWAAPQIARARRNVERWRRDRLCSPHYASRWRRMLTGPTSRVGRALLRDDDWTDALFQNSPFAFALGPAAV